MISLRSRLVAAVLFGLLSLGQAYPFSVAWGMSGKTHACCCHTAMPQPCGCDHGHAKKKFSCHQQKESAGPSLKAAPCGTQTEARSLNFRGESCLPRFARLPLMNVDSLAFEDITLVLPEHSAVPEPPPPRASLPS